MHRPRDPVAAMRSLLDGIHSARADGAPLTWLELALRALRLDPGSAVLTPSLTFCGAVAAIDENTGRTPCTGNTPLR